MSTAVPFVTTVIMGVMTNADDPTRLVADVRAEEPPPRVAVGDDGNNTERHECLLQLDACEPSIAFLWIENRSSNEYIIHGACGDDLLPETKFSGETQKLLDPKRELTSEKIQQSMSEYSVRHPLRQWLNRLLKTHGDNLCLVIEDRSNTGIPWELFKLKKVGHSYVGSTIDTVRWVEAEFDEDEEGEPRPVKLNFHNELCIGPIVTYVDPTERSAVNAEMACIEALGAERIEGPIGRLRERLFCAAPPCALLYCLCHGFTGQLATSIAIGSMKSHADRLHLALLRQDDLQLLKTSRSVVFLNACESGVVVQNTTYMGDEERRGFAELLLGKGARGVIGTLAKVKLGRAAEIGKRLINLALSGAKPVAKVLRELRAEAATQMPVSPTAADYEALFTIFMYVYYGNPRTRIQLQRIGGES